MHTIMAQVGVSDTFIYTYTHSILFRYKNYEILPFVTTCIDLKGFMLRSESDL